MSPVPALLETAAEYSLLLLLLLPDQVNLPGQQADGDMSEPCGPEAAAQAASKFFNISL